MTPEAHRPSRPVAGGLLVLTAGLLFALAGALVKAVSAELPTEVTVFFRNFLAGVFFLAWMLARGGGPRLATGCLGLHLLRAAAGLSAMYCFFLALKLLPLADAMLLNYTTPIFMPLIERAWLKEPLDARTVWAVAVGFVGIVLILKPGVGVFRPAGLVGLASGLLTALAMVGIRRMTATEPVERIVFYFTAFATAASAAPLAWAWKTPSATALAMLAGIGVLAIVAQMCLTRGYGLAPAGQVGPFTYVNVAFAAGLGWLIWGETLDGLTAVGAVLTVASGIIAAGRTGAKGPAADPAAGG